MLYRIKILFLYLFVFSLSFEYWDPFGISSFFTVTKFAGVLYFLLALADIPKNFRIVHVKIPLLILVVLWLILLAQNILNYWHGTTLSVYSFTFLQNIILFWLISNDLRRNEKILKKLFLSLIFGVFIMAVLVSFGIGLSSEVDSEMGSYRLTFFGSNSNGVGNLAAISLLFIAGMVLERNSFFGKKTILLLAFVPSLVSVLSLSGSRGALIVSFVGVVVLLLFQKTSMLQKVLTLAIGSIAMILAVSEILESDIMRRRLLLTTTENSLGGREDIWMHALNIYFENPIIGIGLTGYQHEIIERYGMYMDTHNIFLYFMVSGGIVALSLYLIFLSHMFGAAIRYYKFRRSALLLALLMVYLFSVFKSGGAINGKLNWVIISIVFGLGTSDFLKKRREIG